VREVREETGLDVDVGPLVGMYTVRNPVHTLLCFAFRCEITGGEPAVPDTGEIAEVEWFDPHAPPEPRTNTLGPALEDALAGRLAVARDVPKLN
jgi:8-oxo-dGTP pyrophosphatase MutT (NUDIX family)